MNDDQYKDLRAYLDEQFKKQAADIDKRFAEQDARIEQRFAKQSNDIDHKFRDFKASEDDKYMKLFRYLREEMAAVHTEIQSVNQNVDAIRGLIDVVAKEHEDEQTERLAMNHQLDRHEHWIEQLAEKLDVTLDYQEP